MFYYVDHILGLLSSVSFTGLVDITSGSCILLNLGTLVVSGWLYNAFLIGYNLTLMLINTTTCTRSVYFIYQSSQRVKQMGQVFGKSRQASPYKTLILLTTGGVAGCVSLWNIHQPGGI